MSVSVCVLTAVHQASGPGATRPAAGGHRDRAVAAQSPAGQSPVFLCVCVDIVIGTLPLKAPQGRVTVSVCVSVLTAVHQVDRDATTQSPAGQSDYVCVCVC